jgi:hypothetical protein
MAIHPNPDGSQTEGTKVEPNGTFIEHEFIAVLTSAVGLSNVAAAKTAGANQAVVQAQTQSVSYRLDGTNPTAAVGVFIPANGSIAFNMTDAAAAKFIQTAATATLAVNYTM